MAVQRRPPLRAALDRVKMPTLKAPSLKGRPLCRATAKEAGATGAGAADADPADAVRRRGEAAGQPGVDRDVHHLRGRRGGGALRLRPAPAGRCSSPTPRRRAATWAPTCGAPTTCATTCCPRAGSPVGRPTGTPASPPTTSTSRCPSLAIVLLELRAALRHRLQAHHRLRPGHPAGRGLGLRAAAGHALPGPGAAGGGHRARSCSTGASPSTAATSRPRWPASSPSRSACPSPCSSSAWWPAASTPGKHRALAAVLLALTGLSHLLPDALRGRRRLVLYLLRPGRRRLKFAGRRRRRRGPAGRLLVVPVPAPPALRQQHGLGEAHRVQQEPVPRTNIRWVAGPGPGRAPCARRQPAPGRACSWSAWPPSPAPLFIARPPGPALERPRPALLVPLPLPAGRRRRRRARAAPSAGWLATDPDDPVAAWPGGSRRSPAALAVVDVRRACPSASLPELAAQAGHHRRQLRRRLGQVELLRLRAQDGLPGVQGSRRHHGRRWAGPTAAAAPTGSTSRDLDRFGTPMALMLLPVLDRRLHRLHGGPLLRVVGHRRRTTSSPRPSCPRRRPTPSVTCPTPGIDVAKGVDHLQLLGARYYMAFSPETTGPGRRPPRPHARWPPPASGGSTRCAGSELVSPLGFQPAVITGGGKGERAGWPSCRELVHGLRRPRRASWPPPGPRSGSGSRSQEVATDVEDDRVERRRSPPPSGGRSTPVQVSNISHRATTTSRFDVDRVGVAGAGQGLVLPELEGVGGRAVRTG